jgi:16S rRNA (uracil1498-N3)-methyltransferase
MSTHTLFCSVISSEGEIQELDRREMDHIFKIFRARVGDEVRLLDGKGTIGLGVVEDKKIVRVKEVRIQEKVGFPLKLYCALPRKAKFDTLLKQVAELGVDSIHPVRFARSVADADSPSERWQVLLQEGCKQSHNPFLPVIYDTVSLATALEEIQSNNIACYYGEIADSISPEDKITTPVAWLVGPEGGFTPEELTAIKNANCIPLNLGPWVLRLETAAICGLAVLRKMMAFLLLFGMVSFSSLFLCGCYEGANKDLSKHPLLIKAAEFRKDGEYEVAQKCYLKLIAKYPENASLYQMLGSLFEEEIGDYAAAYNCYKNFLAMADIDDPGRESVVKGMEIIKGKMLKQLVEEETNSLRDVIREKDKEITQNKKIITLQNEQIKKLKRLLFKRINK